MIGGRGSSYIYLVLVAIVGGFMLAGGTRFNNGSYLTKYDNSKLTPAPPAAATPTPGVVGLPGAPTATPTPTPVI